MCVCVWTKTMRGSEPEMTTAFDRRWARVKERAHTLENGDKRLRIASG